MKKRFSVWNLICYLLLILLAVIFLAPFIFTLFTSIKPDEEIYASVMTVFPHTVVPVSYTHLDVYKRQGKNGGLPRWRGRIRLSSAGPY